MHEAKLGWDTSTPFAGNFEVAGVKATGKEGGYYQITGQHPLPNTPNTTHFRIHYGGGRDIGLGILTEARKQEEYSGGYHHK